MARVLVLKAAGINCDEETVHAFRLAGAEVELVDAGALLRGESRLEDFDVFVVPGGFSYGDDLGAGTVLANRLRSRLRAEIEAFVDAGRLVLGICNGFQVLVRFGLLPGWGGEKQVSLIESTRGCFEDRWVTLGVESSASPFLTETVARGGILRVPIAHAEGRLVARDPAVVERLRANGQIALTYRRREADAGGRHALAGGVWPDNPNGSLADIAGISNERGNVLGLMPHPERFVHRLQDPLWTRSVLASRDAADLERAGDGFAIFASAVGFVDGAASANRGGAALARDRGPEFA